MSSSRILCLLKGAKTVFCGLLRGTVYASFVAMPAFFIARDYLFMQDMGKFGHPCPWQFPFGFDCNISPEYGDFSWVTHSNKLRNWEYGLIGSGAIASLIHLGFQKYRANAIRLNEITIHTPLLANQLPEINCYSIFKNCLTTATKTLALLIWTHYVVRNTIRDCITENNPNHYPSSDASFRSAEKSVSPYDYTGLVVTGTVSLFSGIWSLGCKRLQQTPELMPIAPVLK